MTRSWALLLSLATLPCLAGCRCRGGGDDQPVAENPASDAARETSIEAPPEVDLHLLRNALVAFGNTTPLPVSPEFTEDVPVLQPPLERAAAVRADKLVRLQIERDVPFGQVTRLMQAGIGHRIGAWEVHTRGTDGALHAIEMKTPGPLPRGSCFATAWVGPDNKVQVGLDVAMTNPDAKDTEMVGTIVWPVAGKVGVANVLTVVRRLDPRCPEGPFRIYASPSGTWGPAFDLAIGMTAANPKPHVSTLQLAVPSLGPMDSPVEVLK